MSVLELNLWPSMPQVVDEEYAVHDPPTAPQARPGEALTHAFKPEHVTSHQPGAG
eukprot:gene2407-4884_t